MFNNKINTISSPVIIDSLQALLNYIHMGPVYPFIPNRAIYDYDQFNDILEIFEDICNQEDPVFDPRMDIETFSSNATSSTISESSDNQDEICFDPSEWSIKDPLTDKTRHPRLHEFLSLLLDNPRYISYTSWLNKNEGLFKIHQPIKVANLWQIVKSRPTHGITDYDTFARSIRSYYKKNIMIVTHKKHTHRFGSNN